MNPIAFLALALVLSILGIFAVWIRHRESGAPDSTIDEFRSKMRALSEQDEQAHDVSTHDADPSADGARDLDGPTGRGDTTRRGG